MSARSKARKRALDLLYSAEVRDRSPRELLEEEHRAAGQPGARPVNDYTRVLIDGVADHAGQIDEVIARYARGWTLSRMPAVDRNVLRLAVLEILYVDEVPAAVAVSEALTLVRDLSTDESPAFVNGVLGSVVRDRDALRTA